MLLREQWQPHPTVWVVLTAIWIPDIATTIRAPTPITTRSASPWAGAGAGVRATHTGARATITPGGIAVGVGAPATLLVTTPVMVHRVGAAIVGCPAEGPTIMTPGRGRSPEVAEP